MSINICTLPCLTSSVYQHSAVSEKKNHNLINKESRVLTQQCTIAFHKAISKQDVEMFTLFFERCEKFIEASCPPTPPSKKKSIITSSSQTKQISGDQYLYDE